MTWEYVVIGAVGMWVLSNPEWVLAWIRVMWAAALLALVSALVMGWRP